MDIGFNLQWCVTPFCFENQHSPLHTTCPSIDSWNLSLPNHKAVAKFMRKLVMHVQFRTTYCRFVWAYQYQLDLHPHTYTQCARRRFPESIDQIAYYRKYIIWIPKSRLRYSLITYPGPPLNMVLTQFSPPPTPGSFFRRWLPPHQFRGASYDDEVPQNSLNHSWPSVVVVTGQNAAHLFKLYPRRPEGPAAIGMQFPEQQDPGPAAVEDVWPLN